MMRFASPWFLLFLCLVPLWLWWERRRLARRGLQYSSVGAARGLHSFWSVTGPTLLAGLRGLTLLLFVVGLARPQLGRGETKIKTEGIDIVLAVDVSGSMQAMDFKVDDRAVDRLTVVKQVVKEFVENRPNDRIGMVAFAGRAYIASPLTLDHDWLERNLDRLRIGLIEDGTAIGSAIGTAVNRLRNFEAKSKVVILLTDGVNNVPVVRPEDAAKAAKEYGVRIYTIGAGTQGMAPMPVFGRDGQLLGHRAVPVEIDEALLQKIADTTGGQYFRATDTDSLRHIYQQIDQMEKHEIEAPKFEQWRELFGWCVGPGLGMMLIAVALENTRLRRVP